MNTTNSDTAQGRMSTNSSVGRGHHAGGSNNLEARRRTPDVIERSDEHNAGGINQVCQLGNVLFWPDDRPRSQVQHRLRWLEQRVVESVALANNSTAPKIDQDFCFTKSRATSTIMSS